MKKHDLKKFRLSLGLSTPQLAQLLDVSPRMVTDAQVMDDDDPRVTSAIRLIWMSAGLMARDLDATKRRVRELGIVPRWPKRVAKGATRGAPAEADTVDRPDNPS